ncbi:sigma 54-interacting transcriptional regulator [Leptolyngbya sp. FACHB-261]|uniref:sigma 54-interacting transcriptional regulator n=1 Tax=Leptolyngbya sp. FACHB-261 TaxID=2692806 RepID=UPI0016833EA9|nr:sigma 54-interacting transcriptional regulator [Leptolyngbya sp. FACHB-261]MBD2104369.1 sigma 54-interacting transcriptional regulator [Leptolyngbya sp. FACHB-261]
MSTASDPSQVSWLQQMTALNVLSDEVVAALAAAVVVEPFQENRRLVLEDTPPQALYILRQGRLETYHTSPSGPAEAASLLPGAVIHLQELLLDRPAQQTVITLSDGELWTIPKAEFEALSRQYPQIARVVSQQLADELATVASQLALEQERSNTLRPYLVPKATRGIVGSSRYAVRLRQQIREAANDRRPVLIFGEAGTGKVNAAALIHFMSPNRREPLIRLNCGALQTSGADLFGRTGGKLGLLALLGQGTLVLDHAQDLRPELLTKLQVLMRDGTYSPVSRDGEPSAAQTSEARIIFTAEQVVPGLSDERKLLGHTIKVPPLRVRKEDIEAQVNYYASLFSRAESIARPSISPEALRRLQSYDFPGNLPELQSLVERAIVQSRRETGDATELTEEVFWGTREKKRSFRLNLLNAYPALRNFLRSPWWPDRINYGFTFGFFAVVVALLLFGPQTRDQNLALNFFWAWWWPLILVAFPFVGRLWCSVCPFMIYGEVAQKLSLAIYPRQLKTWPRESAERWGGWFLFGLFTLIFLWEELWHLENVAYLSGCLLLLITAGAVIFSLLFERRFWCRYLCPIGGMNGLFAKLSMVELRAQQGVCSAECTTYQCYKGGPQKGEGLETFGCPVYSHPAQLSENRDCVLCMTCLKACPHRSVELNLRPPGIELWTSHTPTTYEVALLLLLFGGTFLHRLPELLPRLGLSWDLENFWVHAGASMLILLIPTAVTLLAYGLIRLFSRKLKPRSFIELAYGYLPLVLGGSLAHYLRLGLTEAGRLLPVGAATFGYGMGTLPVFVAHPAVVEFLQAVTLLASLLLTVVLTQKIARQPFRLLLPQHFAALALTWGLWQLIVGV